MGHVMENVAPQNEIFLIWRKKMPIAGKVWILGRETFMC